MPDEKPAPEASAFMLQECAESKAADISVTSVICRDYSRDDTMARRKFPIMRVQRQEFACKCGVKRFVDVEMPAPGIKQFEPDFLRAHCSKDKDQPVLGRIIQVYIEV
jgi:hypothetical protein